MIHAASHYVALAAAYVRGVLGEPALADDDAIARGLAAGIELHRFKRTAGLPRVRAVREAMRVARTAVIASVPSHADDNPEHVHLFDGRRLDAMFRAAGARRVTIEHVLGHIVVVAVR